MIEVCDTYASHVTTAESESQIPMRTKKDLEAIHASGAAGFGYVDITMFNCPPFVMFTNGNDCPTCWHMLQGLEYEPESLHLWSMIVPLASSVCDIGTRCGEFSLVAAALREDIPIISCEPNPDGFARLVVNVRANDAKNVIMKRVAASNQDGFAKFGWVPKFIGHISSGGHIVDANVSDAGATILVVEIMRLDKIVEGIDLGPRPAIKIDVEGAEAQVFEGMMGVLKSKPDILLETFDQDACDRITTLTAQFGYRYYLIEEDERRIVQIDRLAARGTKQNSRNQFLSCRPPEAVLSLSSRAG